MKKQIIFSSEGESVSDFSVKEYVDNIVNNEKQYYTVSTLLVISEIRARIKEGQIKEAEISIMVLDAYDKLVEINIDENGRTDSWDIIFCLMDEILDRLIM